MMTIVELVQKHFFWLEQDSYSKSIRNNSTITCLFDISYHKQNMSINFYCDIREQNFSFEIFVTTSTKKYSITEYLASQKGIYNENKQFDIVYQRIFDYSGIRYDEISFQNERNELLSRKLYEDVICLYSNLIKESMSKIEYCLLSK